MFGIDFSEILVIFGIALVVLGPEKLPRLARTIGRWLGRARTMARQFREQLEQEADALQRSADLRTPPRSTGTATPPPAATSQSAQSAQPAQPVAPAPPSPAAAVPIVPAAAAASADAPEHHQQPAAAPAEPHERAG
jgi:sec-independent protein translocase protein TatB